MANRRHNGFTLLEMVVAITALAVLAALATPYLSLSVQAYNANATELKVLGELRYASERIARELRDMRRDPASVVSYDITKPFVGNRIVFFRNDGVRVTIEEFAPQQKLNLSYDTLAGEAPFPLSTSLQSLTFNFLQSDEIMIASGGNDLAYIEFEIQLLVNGQPYSQRSRVALRAQP